MLFVLIMYWTLIKLTFKIGAHVISMLCYTLWEWPICIVDDYQAAYAMLQPCLNPPNQQAADYVLLNRWKARNFIFNRGEVVSLTWVHVFYPISFKVLKWWTADCFILYWFCYNSMISENWAWPFVYRTADPTRWVTFSHVRVRTYFSTSSMFLL